MKSIKIIFFSMAFHFFAPVNSYAIVQTYEKQKSSVHGIPEGTDGFLLSGILCLAFSGIPVFKGIILWHAAISLTSIGFGLVFIIGVILILMSLEIDKRKPKHE